MTLDQIYAILVAALPSITAVIGIITVFIKIAKKFGDLRDEVKNSTDIKDVSDQLKVVLQENAELKKSMVALNTKVAHKLDHIYLTEAQSEEQVDGKKDK